MKSLKNNLIINRNLKYFSYPKKYNSKTLNSTHKTKINLAYRPLTKKYLPVRNSPTLYFPVQDKHINSFFLTPRNINLPFSYTNRTVYNNSFNNKNYSRKKIHKSKLNRPINIKSAIMPLKVGYGIT